MAVQQYEAAEVGPNWLADRVMPENRRKWFGPLSQTAAAHLGEPGEIMLPALAIIAVPKWHIFQAEVVHEGQDPMC